MNGQPEIIRTADAVTRLMRQAVAAGHRTPPALKVIASTLGIGRSTAGRHRAAYLRSHPASFPAYRPYRAKCKNKQ